MRHLSLDKQGRHSHPSFNMVGKFQQKTFFPEMETGGHKGKIKLYNLKFKVSILLCVCFYFL